MATGTASNGTTPQGFLLKTANGTTWTAVSLPAADNVLYFDDIDCTAGASATCAAVGATPSGSVVVTSTNSPSGTWSDQTPTGLTGYTTSGVPIEINNTSLAPSQYVTAVTAGGSTNTAVLPTLYPFTNGYGLWAGDCQAESNSYNTTQAATTPGGTSGITSGMSTPTVPLGLAAVQVVHKTGTLIGLPYSGVALTLKVPSNSNGCGQDTYTLQSTGADGLSRTLVPFGTYNVYVNGSGTLYGSLVVAGSTETLTVISGTTVTTTATLPNPVTVGA